MFTPHSSHTLYSTVFPVRFLSRDAIGVLVVGSVYSVEAKGVCTRGRPGVDRRGLCRPVGSGKTALTLVPCQKLRTEYNTATVTNDIFTREDQELLIKHNALPSESILAIETSGGCSYMGALTLQTKFTCQLLFVESGGDNLAANYSRKLADYIIYVIGSSGGDKIPRKGGPGISQSGLLVMNKIDLAPYVNATPTAPGVPGLLAVLHAAKTSSTTFPCRASRS